MITSSAGFVQPFVGSDKNVQSNELSAGQGDSWPEPDSSSSANSPEPLSWVGNEFIISCDDSGFQDAMNPSIMVTPPGNTYANSMHAVWNELDETAGVQTIHYSMSLPSQHGLEWSNDEVSEGDRTINDVFSGLGAINPSIAISANGTIHVVWCQEYPGTPPTYEVRHIKSTNNGQTWFGENPVSFRRGDGTDSQMPLNPKISMSNGYLGTNILHVVWSEYSEIYYSRSANGGDTWSAASESLPPISLPSGDEAQFPDIAVGGINGAIVHVSWSQFNSGTQGNEIYYTRATDAGASGTWQPENTISNTATGPTNLMAGKPKICAFGNNVFTIWDQPLAMDGNSEICISGSTAGGGGGWNGVEYDSIISFNDGQSVDLGSLDILAGVNGEAYAVWTEVDETSPYDSSEIHYSWSATPFDPMSWTGRMHDQVLSYPDGEDSLPANAMAPSMSLANFGGVLKPQIVWSEPNAQAMGRAQHNNEIHYLPQTTFNIPVHLGWNLVSVPLIQNDTNISVVLDDSWGDDSTTWDVVQAYDLSGSAPVWSSYSTFKPSALNSLLSVNQTIGIWVNITALGDGNLTVYGDYGTSTSIPLKAGWNLVGYPAQTSKSVTDSFSGVSGFSACEGYNASNPYRISQLDGSYMMMPGEGYWVKVSADTTWNINW